jgi:hypothetical protein
MTDLKRYEAGDVRLIGIKLTNGSATVDLKGVTLSLSIYEDIEAPTVYAELSISDALNIVRSFPIIGEENIEISFLTPGRDKITTYKLRTFAIESTSIGDNNQFSTYVLKCVSAEHFINAVQQVDKAYDSTVGEMIIDVLVNELQTSKPFTVESTRGLIETIVPRMSPFQAIDFLRQKAVAKRASGGVFVFYENQYGFNFLSLEKLIEEGKKNINSKSFTHSPNITSDKDTQQHAFRNITRLQHLTKFDTIDKLSNGQFKNRVLSYDMLSKGLTSTNFNLVEQAKVFETGEKKTRLTNTDTLIKTADTVTPYIMFAPKDTSKGNDFVTDLLGYRQAFTTMFNQNIVRCMIYGDNYLAVGDMVALNLPDTSGTTEKKVGDKRYSGNYMITKLRHMIYQVDRKFKYDIAMDCNKIGYNE